MSLIVIVDDRPTNRTIFSKLALSIEADVSVHSFGDPREALRWVQDGHMPDLVITDYKMPDMDGAAFIHAFRLLPQCSEIPVVVITVYEERAFRLKALEAGATDFLHSPVDHHEFVTRARNLLKLHKNQILLAKRATSLERELEDSERSRERVLRDSRERLAQVIDTVPILISATGPDGRILFMNAYYTQFYNVDAHEVVGQPLSLLLGEEQASRSNALDKMIFETGKPLPSFEEEQYDKQGIKRVFLTTKSPLREGGQITGVLTSSLDITLRKRTEAHLQHLAHHDALTGLPNRILLHERIRRQIMWSRRGDHSFALHMLDLDGFKSINDLFGHTAGDRYLKAVAERLSSAMRETDTLARLGGDEFAIIQSNVSSGEEAAEFAKRLLSILTDNSDFEGGRIAVTASIGIVLHPRDGLDPEDLLKNADLAMYRAKADQGNHYCFYAEDMQTRARTDAILDSELRDALERKEFVLFYQPQIDLASGRIVGAEALLRWNRPLVGLVTPSVFLPRAEENGLIVPINEWVLREACREAKNWQKIGLPLLRVGVNMSPIQFRRRTVPLLVAKVLSETGLDPRRLDLELTESIVMHDHESVAADLHQLQDLGICVSIDDFGTGYSSLAYVKRFPVNRLKIDQSFIRNVHRELNDAAIVRAIVTLAHSLDMHVVAEGVETADHLAKLREEGVDEVQGFYFAKPMPSDEFIKFVQDEMVSMKSA